MRALLAIMGPMWFNVLLLGITALGIWLIHQQRRAAGITLTTIGALWLLVQCIPGMKRAQPMAQRNSCIANLRQIEGAKEIWDTDQGTNGAAPTATDIAKLLKGQQLPICPAGGTYSMSGVNQKPSCTVAGHTL
ncbi:MAG: hypothetical protein AB1705_26840 [Verrucomicrobiota bacterium]